MENGVGMCGGKEMDLSCTDPACYSSLILVETLDLGQICGRGTLHLETILIEENKQVALDYYYTYFCTAS